MSNPLDYAIVGAGVSGCYAAWRLKQHYPDSAMSLFENSDRIGGRLYSRYLPGMPHVTAELGGMRYMPDSQPLIKTAIGQLGLPTQPFLMGAPPPVGSSENIIFLRDKFFRNKQMDDSTVVPYNVSPSERNKTPDDLRAFVMEYLLPHGGTIPQHKLFDTEVFGKKLYEYGFWDLLLMVLTNEAYTFIKEGGGYDTNVANGNAVSMLPIQEEGAATEFLTLTHGMQSLPRTLAEKFVNQGGECRKNARLKAITNQPDGGYRLHFATTKTEGCKTNPTDDTFEIEAKHIILAMPRVALQSIAWAQFEENAWLRENIPSVAKQPAFKIFMGYDSPWWRSLNLVAGRSITDLPIRQTYYFGTEGEQPDANPNNTNSLLMASYNDLGTVPFSRVLPVQAASLSCKSLI